MQSLLWRSPLYTIVKPLMRAYRNCCSRFFMVFHLATISGGIETIMHALIEAGNPGSDEWMYARLAAGVMRIPYYTLVVWMTRRFISPHLKYIESSDMKGLWFFPVLFGAVSLTLNIYYDSLRISSPYLYITFFLLFTFAFFAYNLLLRILDSAVKKSVLEQVNRIKTEFLQDMSHEMKAPLTLIAAGIDYSDRVIGKEIGVQAAHDALGNIREETQRLGRMVDGMVKIASMSELTEESRRRTDFAALLKSGAESFRIAHKNVALVLDVAPDLPDVFVTADRFKQVVLNILGNAAEHSGTDTITVSANAAGKYIAVRVTDNGGGIPPEILSRVFERGVSTRRDKTGIAGYGLSICKTIIEAHGGEISIESEPGESTAVTFTVPVYSGQKES